MDIADGLYGFFGTNDPSTVVVDILVAVVLAVSIVYLILEAYRVLAEYTRKEVPRALEGPAPMEVRRPLPAMEKPEKKTVEIPAIDVVKGSLPESMLTLTQKYRLDSVTIASQDGLVIASTSKAPDQDAAVYSGLFQELYKVKQEPYYYVESKDVSLYSVESGSSKVIGVAHRKGTMPPEELKAIREDTKSVVDRFAAMAKK